MNNFTLSTVLSTVKENLLKTIGLFILTFIATSNLPIFTEKHELEKYIVLEVDKALSNNLQQNEIESILSSNTFKQILKGNIGLTDIANYEINNKNNTNGGSIIKIIFRSSNKDALLLTSKELISELKKINQLKNRSNIIEIKGQIDANNLMIEYISSIQTIETTDEYEKLLHDDVVSLAKMRKVYKKYEKNDVSLMSHDGIIALTRDKREAANRLSNLNYKKSEFINKNLVLKRAVNRYNSSKGVSYLLPLSENSILKYFPNGLLYSGVSIFISILYNLFIINLIFIRRKG
jgi:hypothetical protein